MPIAAESPPNHRTRVAGERRERTRARLLRGALRVFASQGPDAWVIDLIIREAGVSRGTFYNYFRTNEELFEEVAKEVSNEIIRTVDPVVERQGDPAARLACGVSLAIRMARRFPSLARFVVRGGPAVVTAGGLATIVIERELRAGIAEGRFTINDLRLGFDLVLGPVIAAYGTVLATEAPEDYPERIAEAVLRALGVDAAKAAAATAEPFGTPQPAVDSLFA